MLSELAQGRRPDDRPGPAALPWISVADDAPYFQDEAGQAWTPIGQNDALTWCELDGLLGRRDLESVERHLRRLRDSGVTVLRLMLEYAEEDGAFLEAPAGSFSPLLVQAWDDLVGMARQLGLRLLLTPFDTFFTWNNWDRHPYNRANGGPCADRTCLLTCPDTREAIKRRLAFASERWGGDGVIFAWDLWNELHPSQGEERRDCFDPFISDVGRHLRELEQRIHGRAHLQTASIFGPEFERSPWLKEAIYRHPGLDCATIHLYGEGTIDDPRDTVEPALVVGALVAEAVREIRDRRPFFDSEHGPIHSFKDHGRTLPEAFDDEYFRHIQWAHLAAGGAGGGMRWPNRHPHALTPGMRAAQQALAGFLPLIDWIRFDRRPLALGTDGPALAALGCGDRNQAVLWAVRTDCLGADGRLDPGAPPISPMLYVPGLAPGPCLVTLWDTRSGRIRARWGCDAHRSGLVVHLPDLRSDLAIALRRLDFQAA